MTSLIDKIGAMIMVGFVGTTPEDPAVQNLCRLLSKKKIGGILEFSHNIKSLQQVKTLNQSFQEAAPSDHPFFIAIDQEGGKVQRLNQSNGFKNYLSPKEVRCSLSPQEAKTYYAKMAQNLKSTGFNLNFAPVVDLEGNCPVIGDLERSFGKTYEKIVPYAKAFINAHRACTILTSLKHFPGHGLAEGDSHQGFVDITHTHKQEELTPFYELMREGFADSIMVGHLTDKNRDPALPATLSPHYVNPLLREKGYEGVVISDDLHMGAIVQQYSLEETVLKALQADIDLLVFSQNPSASPTAYGVFSVERVNEIIQTALDQGEISESRICKSFKRLEKARASIL